jgi:hypothetical protein
MVAILFLLLLLFFLFDPGNVRIKAQVCLCYKLAVKALFADA